MMESLLTVVGEYSGFAPTLLIAAMIGAMAERLRANYSRRRWRAHRNWRWREGWQRKSLTLPPVQRVPDAALSKPPDAADQLRIVMEAEFASQSLLNRSEARLFRDLDQMVLTCNPLWQVMAQVSLGEILRTKNRTAYGCVNSKRVDLLLVDEQCQPRHVVEYQGAGHHQSSAAARDAVKKEALRRAGIGYHEVVAGQTTPSELRLLVERLVEKPKASNVADERVSIAPHQSPLRQTVETAAPERRRDAVGDGAIATDVIKAPAGT